MKHLKFILLAFILPFLINKTHAQITIDGTITDAELNPINNALVEIVDEGDTNNVYSSITDGLGNFTIANITDIKTNSDIIPSEHIILRNYPNPFNPTSMIYFELPKSEFIEIKIYDILGKEVRTLFNDFHKAGTDEIIWDGRNNRNSPVAAGIYLCRLKTKDQFKVHKMVLLDGGLSASSFSTSALPLQKSKTIEKINSRFTFTIRVSGNQIITTELSHLVCHGDTTIVLKVPNVLKTATIGSMGGKIELDNFSMEIPEGAFNSNFELRFFKALSYELGENNASKIFGVEGIPLDFTKPLTISIEPEKELSGETYISVGHDYEIPFSNTSEIVYKFMDTQDTLGLLTSKLFPDSAYINKNLTKTISSGHKQHKIYFTSETGYRSDTSIYKHFAIFSEKNIEYYRITQLGNSLEYSFGLVTAAGFDTLNINLPVDVYVKKLKPELVKRGCIYYPTYGSKNISLLIDQDRLNAARSLLREYAIGVFRTYDKDFFLPFEFTGKVNPEHYWFHHAVASWFEEKRWLPQIDYEFFPTDYCVNEQGDFEGEDSGDNTLSPFSGMKTGAGNDSKSALKHGGGMSSFIKYIEKHYGEAPIVNIYDHIKEDHLHPIDGIKRILSDPYIWWPDYFEEYMEGQLYPFSKFGAFELYDEYAEGMINIWGGSYAFKDKNDTLKTFENVKFPSLSAKAFLIEWNASDIDSSRIIRFKLKENENTLFAYGLKKNEEDVDKYLLLGKGTSYSGKVEELLKIGIDHFVIVVTNAESEPPYNNLTNINLEVKLEKPPQVAMDVNRVQIMVDLGANFEYSDGTPSTGRFKYQNSTSDSQRKGEFKNNKFTVNWNEPLWDGSFSGSIEFLFDTASTPGYFKITDYFITETLIRPLDTTGTYVQKREFSGNGKSIYGYYNENIFYAYVYMAGNNVCEYIDYIVDEQIYPEWWLKLKNWFCDNDSYFEIKFWKE